MWVLCFVVSNGTAEVHMYMEGLGGIGGKS